MADVKVGQVRREKPRTVLISGEPEPVYGAAPFRVLRFEKRKVAGLMVPVAIIVALDGTRERAKRLDAVARCGVWPSEHEQWKDARGYEVKT